jgi:hypothetical protein
MKIEEVIATINQMQRDGVIERYAIGGAVGDTFYLEPVATLDVDIFVSFKSQPGSLLASPQPIFDYLTQRGATVEGEYLVIAGWPVQFLPPTGPLGEEALGQAIEVEVEGEPARVFSTSPRSRCSLGRGRTRRACFNSWNPACSTRMASSPSSPATASLISGRPSPNNFSSHDLRPAFHPPEQGRSAPAPRRPAHRRKAAPAGRAARPRPHPRRQPQIPESHDSMTSLTHCPMGEILKALGQQEAEIQQGMKELEGMLK